MKIRTLFCSALAALLLTAFIGEYIPSQANASGSNYHRPYRSYTKRPIKRPIKKRSARKPAAQKKPVDTRTAEEKAEALNCPHGTVDECTKYFLAFQDEEERNAALRNYASKLLSDEKAEDSLKVIKIAESEAYKIDDNYTQANNLRFIAEQYYKRSMKEDALRVCSKAMDVVWRISYVPRKLSGMIGIIEIQKVSKDNEGVRSSAMWAIHSGLLQEVAATGKPGEINRMMSNLNRMLYPSDIVQIMEILRGINDVNFRKHVAYKLTDLNFSSGTDPAPVTSEQVNGLSPTLWTQTDNFEQVILLCLMARLDLAQGEARIKEAEKIAKTLPEEQQEKTKDILSGSKAKLKEALSIFKVKEE